jgi:hypothetical protein
MKFMTTLTVITFITITASSQNKNSLYVSAGRSFNGTGDLKGIALDVFHEHQLNKRLSIVNGIGNTIHWGTHTGFNFLSPGSSPREKLFRYTTAGLQFNSQISFTLLNFSDNKIKVAAGPMVRFQSSSLPAMFQYVQDQRFYFEPFYVFNNTEKQNTFSPGYNVSLSYINSISYKYKVGFKAAFQNDTQADVITQLSIILGANLN